MANVLYERSVPLTKGEDYKKHLFLSNYTFDERVNKFLEFCDAYDKREDDILGPNYQQLSHRLHWAEMPYVEEMKHEKDLETLLHHTIVWSFTNEHWQTFRTLRDHGVEAMRSRFGNERHARADLFQIYYPKDTKVKDWLCDVPPIIAKDCVHLLKGDRPLHMMELASKLEQYCKNNLIDHGYNNFRNVMYPFKNLSRHIAMARPDLVDPDTWVTPGTLSFYGLWQIFEGKNLFGKTKFQLNEVTGEYLPMNKEAEELVYQFNYLADVQKQRGGPMKYHYNINIEDKACMFCKHVYIRNGVKSTTKVIPYNWVYPDNYNLSTNMYDRQNEEVCLLDFATE